MITVDSDVRAIFRTALRAHNAEYSHLLAMRGYVPLPRGLSDEIVEQLDEDKTVEEFARLLLRERPAGSRLLFYTYAGEHLHTFVLDQVGLRSHRSQVIDSAALVEAMEETRGAFIALSMPAEARGLMPRISLKPGWTAEALRSRGTDLLFDASTAAAVMDAKHLIIVPTLNIGTVPFAAMDPTGSGEPLIARMTISIAPNIVDLTRTLPADAPREEPLVVGDPTCELPGALQEALGVADELGVTPLTGVNATKQEVMARLDKASILYFATHGSSDPNDPLNEGSLQLANSETLSAMEVQKRKLTAGLAVLSACRTGLGAPHKGGMIGLARAFILAGVPRVVMSLWSVDDEMTRTLMGHFLRSLTAAAPHEALRQAMLEVRKGSPAPFYWAPFVLFGVP